MCQLLHHMNCTPASSQASWHVCFAGYLQKQSGSVMSLPKGLSTATLRISPNFDPNSATPLSVTANIDPVYGSVHETINVPATAKAQPYSISLLVPSSNQGATAKQPSATAPGLAPNVVSPSIPPPDGGNMVSVSNVGFTVADPRPPTAELAVTVPAWVSGGYLGPAAAALLLCHRHCTAPSNGIGSVLLCQHGCCVLVSLMTLWQAAKLQT